MLDYKQLLFKSLDLLLTGWEVEPDSDGDIHLTIPEYKELDQEYPDFLSFLKSLPQIHQHRNLLQMQRLLLEQILWRLWKQQKKNQLILKLS